MDPRLGEIIRFLNQAKVRATYGAVARVLGVVPQSMGARLGPHTIEAPDRQCEDGLADGLHGR